MDGIVDAYIVWQENLGDDGLDAPPCVVPMELRQGTVSIQLVDVFCKIFPGTRRYAC
jgi:hypothetical protein